MFLLYACHSLKALENLREQPECADTQLAGPHLHQGRADNSSAHHNS